MRKLTERWSSKHPYHWLTAHGFTSGRAAVGVPYGDMKNYIRPRLIDENGHWSIPQTRRPSSVDLDLRPSMPESIPFGINTPITGSGHKRERGDPSCRSMARDEREFSTKSYHVATKRSKCLPTSDHGRIVRQMSMVKHAEKPFAKIKKSTTTIQSLQSLPAEDISKQAMNKPHQRWARLPH